MMTFSLNKTFADKAVIDEIYPVLERSLTSYSNKGREWLGEFCLRPVNGVSNAGKANSLEAFATVCDRYTFNKSVRKETRILNEEEESKYCFGLHGVPAHEIRVFDDMDSILLAEEMDVICETYWFVRDYLEEKKGVSLKELIEMALKGKPAPVSKLNAILNQYNDFEEFASIKYLWKEGQQMFTLKHRVSAWMQENTFKTLILTIFKSEELLKRLNFSDTISPVSRRF